MPHPLLCQWQRNFGGLSLDSEAVANAFGGGVEPLNSRVLHDFLYPSPACGPRPGPQAAVPEVCELMNCVESLQKIRRYRNGAIDATPPLLQTLDDDQASG